MEIDRITDERDKTDLHRFFLRNIMEIDRITDERDKNGFTQIFL